MGMLDGDLFQKLRFRARAMKYARRVDPAEIRFIRRLLRPGDLAIDAGACKGAYIYWLQKAVTPSGRVVAFEPQKAAAEYLDHVKQISGYRHVEIVNCALSNSTAVRTMYVSAAGISPSASFAEGVFPGHEATASVKTVTLDGYVQGRPELAQPRFIKIDVEAHEMEVIQGASELLASARPVVQVEASQHVYGDRPISAIFDLLRRPGLEGFFFFHGKLHPLQAFDPATHQPAHESVAHNYRAFVDNFLFMDPAKERPILQHYGVAR